MFGSFLGGIWGDESWGRFWGWDPKENGAMLICMWQLMMIHMRLSGIAKPREFALGMGLNNIIVALAWFGVNLLQVGLHSYGFDDGVARNLFIFIGLGIAIGMTLLSFIAGESKPDSEKLSAYECGFEAFDDARGRFDVRFYLVAILFIIFDLEVAFLFPWAI